MLVPTTQEFKTLDQFHKALVAQKDAVVLLDAGEIGLDAVELDGTVAGTDYRLSQAAFGDMCNFAKMPSGFIKRVAKVDEQLALDLISSQLSTTFRRGGTKSFVVDTRSKRIEGIVGRDSYSPLSNLDALNFSMSAENGLEFSGGWLSGPNMRLTTVNRLKPVEPTEGDIVNLGSAISNSIHGDSSVRIAAYCERLVCLNGMTRRDRGYGAVIPHRGDVELNVQRAVVQCAENSQQFVRLMEYAAERFLTGDEIKTIRRFLSDTRNGGNPTIERSVLTRAQQEAQNEGRDSVSVTLWNFVNGTTSCAREAKSIQRRAEIEELGSKLLEFGSRLSPNEAVLN